MGFYVGLYVHINAWFCPMSFIELRQLTRLSLFVCALPSLALPVVSVARSP